MHRGNGPASRLGVLLVSSLLAGSAHTQQPVPPPSFTAVGLSIQSVTPDAPVTGDAVVVAYTVTSSRLSHQSVAGVVSASLGTQTLTGSGNQSLVPLTIAPGGSSSGTFQLASAPPGQNVLTVSFLGPCPPLQKGQFKLCKRPVYATATRTVSVMPPTVHVRIAGTTYTKLSKPDQDDGSSANKGYQCVVHDPGCRSWIFSVGNNGTDKFFSNKSLPPGATLEGVDFIQYWPACINSAAAGGDVFGAGTYGASLDPGNQTAQVKWKNTCEHDLGGKDLWYSISFRIAMPQGTDLGEAAQSATDQPNSPCLPSNYSPVKQTACSAPPPPVPTPQVATMYLANQGVSFVGSFGANSTGGTITSLTNDQDIPVVLLSKANSPAGCQASGNVTLAAHQATTSAQLQSLYGSTSLKYPAVIGACAPNLSLQSIMMTVMYVPSQ